MKILLIAYSFPPLWEPQAIRWYYLSRELSSLGLNIDVVTVKYPSNESVYIPLNIKIHRIFPGPFEFLAFKSREVIGVDRNAKIRRKPFFNVAKKIYRLSKSFLTNLLPGDARTEWFPFALNYIRNKLDVKNYDWIITSHEPYVDSLLGLYLKKKYPKIKWFADIADPFTAWYYPKWRKSIDKKTEKKVLTMADKISVTSENLIKQYIESYGISEEKILLIRQGFNLNQTQSKNNNKKITFAYVGTFYKNVREPGNLFSALNDLDFDFDFVIAGRNEEFLPDSSYLKKRIRFLGFVSHLKALEIQRKADVLIHLTYKNKTQVPGKFFEYLGSGVPILCITYDENDETAVLTKKLNVGLVCKNEKEDIKKSLQYLYKLWQENKIKETFTLNPENFKEYSWQAYASIIHKSLISF